MHSAFVPLFLFALLASTCPGDHVGNAQVCTASALYANGTFKVLLLALLVLFLVGHHFFGYKSSVMFVLSVDSVNVVSSTVF